MKNTKFFAFVAAFLMIMVAGIAVIGISDDSDATITGNYKVYYYNGTSWADATAQTYDLYQAIDAKKSELNFDIVADGSNLSGYNPNINYGTISSLGIITEENGVSTTNYTTNFTVFVFNNTTQQWVVAESALGWYRCYSDYAQYVTFPNSSWGAGSTAGAANVAICAGTFSTIPSGYSATIGLTQVTQNDSDFEYVFTLKDQYGTAYSTSGTQVLYYDAEWDSWENGEITTSMLQRDAGVKVKGYGSDVYLALRDAIKSTNLTAQEITWVYHDNDTPNDTSDDYYTFYSWIDEMLNVRTLGPTNGSDEGGNYSLYVYWSFNTPTDWMSYSPGYYSQIDGSLGGDVGGNFLYTYYLSKYYY